MLSYRHAFHAGNAADVLKHSVLVLILEYYLRKEKPVCYVDTHAGAGRHDLNSPAAQQTREYTRGVQVIQEHAADAPAELHTYWQLVQQLNPGGLQHYPGSPWLAAQLLRPADTLRLFEMHPADFKALSRYFQADKRVRVFQQDGLSGLHSLLPPPSRRAVVLLDPAYELKTEYTAITAALCKAYQRFPTGTYLLWYPVIIRQRITSMLRLLQQARFAELLQVELCWLPDTNGLGMTGSGLFIINPPWVLADQLRSLLPWMTRTLAGTQGTWLVQTPNPA